MTLISCNMAESSVLNEEHRLRRDTLAKNLLLLRRGDVLESTSSFSRSQLSRSYVEQVSSVAWPKAKHGRPRSNSYPFIKRWSPLPRVEEEDESLEETPTGTHLCVANVNVQTLSWTDNKLSQQWLCKIDSLRSTMALMDSSCSRVKHGRPRSNSFPFIKRLIPLPSVTEEEEEIEDGKPVSTNPEALQVQPLNWTAHNKISHDLLDKINSLRSSLSTIDHSSRSLGPDRSQKTVEEVSCYNPWIKMETSQMRKPDSTYISLISGFTHESLKRTHAQSKVDVSDTNELAMDSQLKRGKNCKNLKCIAFSPRKLFCSPQRQNVHRHLSESSEYIPQMGC